MTTVKLLYKNSKIYTVTENKWNAFNEMFLQNTLN